jgi:polar amino acid transport system substrate-binding protein
MHIAIDPMPGQVLSRDDRPLTLAPEESSGTSIQLRDIIDVEILQPLVEDFYALAHLPISIIDARGELLVGVGWQDICTKYHRVHPETCKNCVESDTQLSAGVPVGEYKLYKCKNSMWDLATPLMVDAQHVGNVFSGQFFFDDEPLDWEMFRAQAKRYGFDEKSYITAVEAVPRLSRESVSKGMAFLTKLAHMVSQMGYSNLSLTQALAERKRSEEALIRSEKLASVGRMAATVAHEINNPLAAVTNCIYIVACSPKLPPELKEHLAIAERELHRVAHITRRTLGFYREDAKPAIVDIRKLVDEVVELYGPKLTRKEIRLHIEDDGRCSGTLCVAGEIRQVISNLLVNAIDASEPNSTVGIRISRATIKDSRYTRVTVADNGCGISAANQKQLFEPFFTTKESVGTGLGLWVSHEIIEKHNGHIRVRSVEGKGTVFSVFLPVQT